MQTELQVSLDSESHLHPENISFQDGDPDLTLSTTDDVLAKKPGMLLFYIFFTCYRWFRECGSLGGRKSHL